MSRVGKNPIKIPQGVTVQMEGTVVTVNGPRGSLSREIPQEIDVQVNGGSLMVLRRDESRRSRAMHGLMRALVGNMVTGVSEGFRKVLEIHGIGYRADASGNILTLTLGYSHPVQYVLPEGITAKVEKQTVIGLEGIDRELLGETAAKIRALRPVEPYKGKGIRYANETVRRKAGKAGAKK